RHPPGAAHARGPAHLGAQFETALQAAADDVFRQAWADGQRDGREAYLFDALVQLASRGASRRSGQSIGPWCEWIWTPSLEATSRRRSGVGSPASGPSPCASPAKSWETRCSSWSSRGARTSSPSSTWVEARWGAEGGVVVDPTDLQPGRV